MTLMISSPAADQLITKIIRQKNRRLCHTESNQVFQSVIQDSKKRSYFSAVKFALNVFLADGSI